MVNDSKIGIQRIAPPEVPKCIRVKVGCIKIRLSYLTFDPKHMRSQMLKVSCGAKPPFAEDVCILMPRMKISLNRQIFDSALSRLQLSGVVSPSAKLTGYTFLEEDDDTLAYVVT